MAACGKKLDVGALLMPLCASAECDVIGRDELAAILKLYATAAGFGNAVSVEARCRQHDVRFFNRAS
jgi:hypothetical protein